MQRRSLIAIGLGISLLWAFAASQASDPQWTLPADGSFARRSAAAEGIDRFEGRARVTAVAHFAWTADSESEPAQLFAALELEAEALERLPRLGSSPPILLMIESEDAARRLLPGDTASRLLERRLEKGAWKVELADGTPWSSDECSRLSPWAPPMSRLKRESRPPSGAAVDDALLKPPR
jgi:hypothetical protein